MNNKHPNNYYGHFWAKVEKTDTCWLWKGARRIENTLKYRKNFVYGKAWNGEKLVRAHRLSYEITYGPIPKGLFICHKCDVPLCVRPEHLYAGTPADNVRDMVSKKRHRWGHASL